MKLILPAKDGSVADCVLGFETAAEYDRHRAHTNCFGATIGRVANRMANAEYTIDGVQTKVEVNASDKHHLHGGAIGWHRRKWESREIFNGVEFTYLSKDGDDQYSGSIITNVRYTLNDNKLNCVFESRLVEGEWPKSSPINLTNHTYFNLGGHTSKNGILDHELQIHAYGFCPMDADSIPTKEIKSFEEVPSMDFRKEKEMQTAIKELGAANGYSESEI